MASKTQFSGRFVARVGPQIHAALAKRADKEGVSMNFLLKTMVLDGLDQARPFFGLRGAERLVPRRDFNGAKK